MRLITKEMSPKLKSRIKCALISGLILFIVACFVGLVIGLSLGLAPHNCSHGYLTLCSYNSQCVDLQTNTSNCGSCNNTCPVYASCQSGHCAVCAINCSSINACSVAPCHNGTGCSALDCDNDGNACTTSPCNTTSGCAYIDCNNDNNVCTQGSCNSVNGCPTINCIHDGNPCTEEPCNAFTGCTNVCPILYLSGTTPNYAQNISGAPTTPVAIVSSELQLYSAPNIANVTVTPDHIIAGSTITTTSSIPGTITASYTDGVYTLIGVDTAARYQSVLAGLTYQATFTLPKVIEFSFAVANNKPTNLPQDAVSTITFIIG